MNPFRRMVTVGHNARAFVSNRRPTEQEETVKRRSEGNMQRDAWYRGRARIDPPPGCLWQLWRSAFTPTEPFRPDGNIFCWCSEPAMFTPVYPWEPVSGRCRRCSLLACLVPGAYLTTWDAFHGHSQQRCTNSHSSEERPNDLLTGQKIVNSSSSEYLYIWSTATFGTHLFPSRDPGTFPGHTWWPARSTATSSTHPGVAEPKVECFASRH